MIYYTSNLKVNGLYVTRIHKNIESYNIMNYYCCSYWSRPFMN